MPWGIRIDPELSKRAYKITRTDAYVNMKPQDRLKFIHVVESVNSYDELPEKCKDIIRSGEREMQGY